jgi:hypothetical protein
MSACCGGSGGADKAERRGAPGAGGSAAVPKTGRATGIEGEAWVSISQDKAAQPDQREAEYRRERKAGALEGSDPVRRGSGFLFKLTAGRARYLLRILARQASS